MIASGGTEVSAPHSDRPPSGPDRLRFEWGATTPTQPSAARPRRREQIVTAATHLFHQRGYAEVTMEEIAAEVGLTTSGLNRHFRGKSDLLMTTFQTASEQLDASVEAAGVRGVAARVGLERLARAYVDHCFAHREQMSVYSSAALSLASGDQARLRHLQRDHVDLWSTLLCAHHAGLEPREARTLAYAAINVVTDVGRRLGWQTASGERERVSGIILTVLLGDVAPAATDR